MPAKPEVQPGAASADSIRRAVRDGYAKVAKGKGSCCGPSCCGSVAVDPARSVSESIGYSPEELDAKVSELEQELREKEQELADLRMLVEILEGRRERLSPAPAAVETMEESEQATVGDLMEDQLKYLMEDQMVRELLKE